MKHLKSIALIVLIPLMTFCTNQRAEKSNDRDYTSAQLMGKWNRDYSDKSLNDTDIKIDFIRLVNDSIAEVHINDSTGQRRIIGTWKNKFEKEIGNTDIKMESDIHILYLRDEDHAHMLLLQISEENEKLVMTTHNCKFIKE